MPLLADYLRRKLIPWMSDKPAERFIVGRTRMQQAHMPSGVALARRAIKGDRGYPRSADGAEHTIRMLRKGALLFSKVSGL